MILLVVFATNIAFRAQSKQDADRELATLYVTVTDRYGRNVTGLKAENFKILDEGEEKPVVWFSPETEPSSIGILIDVSGSMLPANIAAASDELITFISEGTPGNEYFAFTFSDVFNSLTGLTKDRQDAKAAIKKAAFIKPYGNKKLYDAIKAAFEHLAKAEYGRKVIVILGDASDNNSRSGYGQIKELIRDSNVSLYSLAGFRLGRSDGLSPNQTINDIYSLSEMSGGRAYFFESLKEVKENLRRINLALQTQYLIGFEPTKSSSKHKRDWRKIKIKMDYPKNRNFEKGLIVAARDGYYAPIK